jgi:fructoselysine-6-phosphate deglycase
MLKFDEARFLRIQQGAISLASQIDSVVASKLKDGAKNLFFLGTGGVAYLMEPACTLLQRRSSFPVFLDYPAELVLTGSVNLTPDSIVVMPSLSGTTPESVAMLEKLKEIGATVLTFVGNEDTPLGRGGDETFVNFAEDDTSCESFYLQALFVALSIMKFRGEISNFDQMVAELETMPELLLEVKRSFEPRAEDFAKRIAGSDYHIFTGGGNVWTSAKYYATCILEEMQWIKTRPINASDFFHGTLELVEKDVSVMLFKGEDEYRKLSERVDKFALTYTENLTVLDTKDFLLPGITDEVRGLVSPIVIATVLERVSTYLEVMRDHPLTTRRYYRRVSY